MRPTRLALVAVITAVMVIGLVPAASAVPKRDRATLMEYAEDTWRSFEAMVEPSTGLVADNIEGDLEPGNAQRVHVAHQYRRIPLEHRRSA